MFTISLPTYYRYITLSLLLILFLAYCLFIDLAYILDSYTCICARARARACVCVCVCVHIVFTKLSTTPIPLGT